MAKTNLPAATEAEGTQLATDQKDLKLRAEVSEKYALDKSVKPGRYHFPGFGEVDLVTLTLPMADNLVARGFPYLKEKNKKDTDASPAQ